MNTVSVWVSRCVFFCSAFVIPAFAQDTPLPSDTATDELMRRVLPATPEVIKEFEDAGMSGVRAHQLTDDERSKIAHALSSLPSLHRTILADRLERLSFLDGIAGEGTALTAPSGKDDAYSITFRASVINESLTEFLTTKEQRLFTSFDGSPKIAVSADGLDALTFAFLHESTHIVDNVIGIKTNPQNPLIVNQWKSLKTLKMPYANSIISNTTFRGAGKIPIEQAPSVYDALASSPFVTLYSTAAASEDIAELVAWYQERKIAKATLVIEIIGADAKVLRRYEPLKFPLVVARYAQVKKLLLSPSPRRISPVASD